MDTSSNEQPAARIATSRGKWILLTTVLGSSMVLLGSTVTNVALPHMSEDLTADLAALQWTVNAYMVTLAGLILLGGALGDRFGRRRIFVLGVVWFATASLLCGLATDTGTLVTVCVYAGLGGFFFLTALQLQIVVGYSALEAGAALLPTSVLMLVFSSHSGELARHLGPRIPLTVGPLLCAAGMLLMLRVDTGASYVPHILPALVVLGAPGWSSWSLR